MTFKFFLTLKMSQVEHVASSARFSCEVEMWQNEADRCTTETENDIRIDETDEMSGFALEMQEFHSDSWWTVCWMTTFNNRSICSFQ